MGFTLSLKLIYLLPGLLLVVASATGLILASTRAAASYGLWTMLEENPTITEKVPIVAMIAVYIMGLTCSIISNLIYSASTRCARERGVHSLIVYGIKLCMCVCDRG